MLFLVNLPEPASSVPAKVKLSRLTLIPSEMLSVSTELSEIPSKKELLTTLIATYLFPAPSVVISYVKFKLLSVHIEP